MEPFRERVGEVHVVPGLRTRTVEPLPGVLGNKGTGAFIFREHGIFSNYFQGTRELLNRLLGTREHQSNLKGFFNFPSPLNISSVGRDYCYERYVALCFDQDGHMYVSTFTGAVYAVQLHFNLISINGTVTSSLQLSSTLLYGIVSLKNVVYVSAHDDNGGIYKLNFNHDNCGLAENIVSNGGSLCNKVHSLTTYNDNSFAFSDTGDSCIKA